MALRKWNETRQKSAQKRPKTAKNGQKLAKIDVLAHNLAD